MLSHTQSLDTYWRLDDYLNTANKAVRAHLKENSIPHRPNASKAELRTHLHRLDRGLLAYSNCKENELRRFARQRKIRVPKGSTAHEVQQLLEAADETPNFHGFMDLPPEMRDRIADFHMAEFGDINWKMGEDGYLKLLSKKEAAERKALEFKPLQHPTQPPLTRVCKLLRKEMLPKFYKQCTFEINIAYTMKKAGSAQDKGQKLAKIHPDTRAWMAESLSSPTNNIKALKFIRLRVIRFDDENLPLKEAVECFSYDIKLDDGDEGCKLARTVNRYKDAHKAVQPALRSILKEINEREGAAKFSMDDIFAFRMAIEKNFGWPWRDVYMRH